MKKSVWKKRLVSMLLVIVLIASILIYTKTTINAEVNETVVYVTKTDIPPRTKITEEMVVKHTLPSRGIPLNAVTELDEIVGKWTISGYGIAANSFIYENKIVKQKELPDAGLLELKDGEIAVPLLVDLETSLGNSIVPNSNVDLYFKKSLADEDNQELAMLGVLASNIRVVAVKDSTASNVFDSTGQVDSTESNNVTNSSSNELAKIYIFAVPKELGELIVKGKMLGEVFPVATGETYKSDLEVESTNNEVVEYLNTSTYMSEALVQEEIEKLGSEE